MEQYIGFVMTLFLLSMICERLADYLKHFIGEQNTLVAVWLKKYLVIGNTIDKGLPDSQQEDKRYFRILKINIFCGFVTAISLHADLFTILSNIKTPEKVFTWTGYTVEWWYIIPYKIVNGTNEQSFLLFLLGCLLTGFFISFGSKFWHDMLDLLLEFKNVRRKLTDPRTFSMTDNIESFDAFIKAPESKLASTANDLHRDRLLQLPGVLSVGPGYMEMPEGVIGCLEVHLANDKAMQQVPATVSIVVGTMNVPIPVNKIVTGNTVIQADIFGAGILATNQLKANGWGSLGCVVKKKGNPTDRYILSCYHVLSGNLSLSQPDLIKEVLIKQENKEGIPEEEVAVISEGMRTEKLDAAIARITDTPGQYSNALLSNPKLIGTVTPIDAKKRAGVRFFSPIRKAEFSGVIHNDSFNKKFPYPDMEWELQDLIVLTRQVGNNNRPISVKGDSGSLILDDSNTALGIVVGADDCFTYAVKMIHIEKQFGIELI